MSITLIIGPMFSGKTTELIKLVDRKLFANKKCLVIKHIIDTRYDKNDQTSHTNCIITHNKICHTNSDIITMSDLDDDNKISELIESNYDVIAIEEGHFFPGLVKGCVTLANANIDVIVSALDSSFKQELFTNVGNLIANAESVIKLSAVCMLCNNADAHFTIRLIDRTEQILVGGTDIYKSVCRKCLNSYKLSKAKC